jgi:nitrite reductase/ring-hydroxylating ferredoxin subunit/uncharacterized membrane protein
MAATTDQATWTAPAPQGPPAHRLVARIAGLEALDKPAKAVGKRVRSLLKAGSLKDALSGTWLGHALHPMLTDVPIGAWTSAVILDVIGGPESAPAAEKLIGVGLAAAAPTALSGWSDWADTEIADDDVRRIGVVHATTNATAIGLYAASLAARRHGRRGRGIALGLAGAGTIGFGGFLGGHLSLNKGVGVDQTTFEPGLTDWTDAASDADIPEGAAERILVDGAAVMITRQEGRVYALADRCSHRGGPLHEGEIQDGCVTCPWHDSVFRLADGSVVRGPAAYPQPAYDVRVRDGRIELKGGG